MSVKVTQTFKHGSNTFIVNHVYGFENPQAAPYIVAAGWGQMVDQPAEYVVPAEDFEIDPGTIHHESGLLMTDLMKHGSVEKAKKAGAVPGGTPQQVAPSDIVQPSA